MERCEDKGGQEDGIKSPSLSNLSLERVKEALPATVEEKCLVEKDEDSRQALVGDTSRSVSKEQLEEAERAIGL